MDPVHELTATELSDEGLGGLSEEQTVLAWHRIRAAVYPVVERGQTELLWNVQGGSSLAEDDRRTKPWNASHAASMALASSLDHLHALCVLVLDAKALHPYAPYTLARGCLENAGAALWMLHPASRVERITRTMRLHAANIRDSASAMSEIGIDQPRSAEERVADLRVVAERNGCPVGEALNPMRPTEIMRYAEANETSRQLGPLFAWRLCSGFSHGRPWSSLGLLDTSRRRRADGEDGFVELTQTNSLDRLLYPTLAGFSLVQMAARTFEKRAQRAFAR